MKALLKKLRYALEAAAVHLIYGFFWLMPLDAASGFGGRLMRFLGPRLGLSTRARRNLEKAFPEKSADEIAAIAADMWENLGRVMAEYPHLDEIWPRVEVIGAEHIRALADDGRPGIMVGGHLANWEVQAVAVKHHGLGLALVYRRPNNPWVDGLICRARQVGSVDHIPKGGEGARALVSILKKGGHLGVLIDQKLNEGLPVPFFGRVAMTAPAVAVFARKFAAPIHPVRVERLGGAHFRMTVLPELDIKHLDDDYKIMSEINRMIEFWVRERPGQWLWIHNRWKD